MQTKQPDDEQLLNKPVVEGILAELRAAHKNGVKRVVVTSSCLAIFQKFRENHKASYNEDDWADEGACAPYDKSKLLAERAAWDFHKNLYLRLKDSSLSSAFLLSFWDPILSQENSLPKIT